VLYSILEGLAAEQVRACVSVCGWVCAYLCEDSGHLGQALVLRPEQRGVLGLHQPHQLLVHDAPLLLVPLHGEVVQPPPQRGRGVKPGAALELTHL
jgi:hypothetical protein